MVVRAGRIKPRSASRTVRIALQIRLNGQFFFASAAQDSRLLPFAARPNLNRMPRQCYVAILTSIVKSAALDLDGDDVERRVVVHTTGLGIEIEAKDGGHRSESI